MSEKSNTKKCRLTENRIAWEALERGFAYPEDDSARGGVVRLQTHISNVFLTPNRVYKFRKPVQLDFLDFSTREKRNADCLREIAVNRRFAPDVYLGVAALYETEGDLRVGPVREQLEFVSADGKTLEHCVVMRRLPNGRDALSLLQQGLLRQEQIERVAERVAQIHRASRLETPKDWTPQAWFERVAIPTRDCVETLARFSPSLIDAEALRCVQEKLENFLQKHASHFEQRRAAGCFVNGHGDLHLQHIWFETDAAPPLLIDAIEFRDDFRHLDPASEVAFCAMDLRYRRRSRFAEQFLCHYAQCSDDFGLYHVVDYFIAYRALVRAKVAILASAQTDLEAAQREAAVQSARRHLELAVRALSFRGKPGLVVVTGVVGTGKSSAAKIVADELGGVIVASDRVRKHLVGVSATTRLGNHENAAHAYGDDMTDRVYRGLLERARAVIDSGRVAVLDAVFAKRAQRQLAFDFAQQHKIVSYLIETRCAAALVLERLQARKLRDDNPSDAGPEFYATSAAGYEETSEWPAAAKLTVDTAHAMWSSEFRSQALRFLRDVR